MKVCFLVVLICLAFALSSQAWEKAQVSYFDKDVGVRCITKTSHLIINFSLPMNVDPMAAAHLYVDLETRPEIEVEFGGTNPDTKIYPPILMVRTPNSLIPVVNILRLKFIHGIEGAGVAHGPGTVDDGVTTGLNIHARTGKVCLFFKTGPVPSRFRSHFMFSDKGHAVKVSVDKVEPYILYVDGFPFMGYDMQVNILSDGQACEDFGH